METAARVGTGVVVWHEECFAQILNAKCWVDHLTSMPHPLVADRDKREQSSDREEAHFYIAERRRRIVKRSRRRRKKKRRR